MWILILLLFVISEDAIASPVDEVKEAYISGDFGKVERIVKQCVTDSSLSEVEKGELYFILGCVESLRGRVEAAEIAFRQALALNPGLSYTSADIPPPAWLIYKSIYDDFIKISLNQAEDKDFKIKDKLEFTHIDTIQIIKPQLVYHKTAWKSLIYPGWGHLDEGNKKGIYFIVGETILLSSWLWILKTTYDKRNDYLTSKNRVDISNKYKIYNRYYQLQWGFGLAALSLYLFAQYDFFSQPPSDIETIGANIRYPVSLMMCIKF